MLKFFIVDACASGRCGQLCANGLVLPEPLELSKAVAQPVKFGDVRRYLSMHPWPAK